MNRNTFMRLTYFK